tara:strand:+ start:13405 stop:14295 length:891 start_codon:yes stop_codon:yes gene_type:complete
MPVELCLGSAQFGLNYGITNNSGQVSEDIAQSIIQQSIQHGIRWIDTAQMYGNAEEVLGRLLPREVGYRIVSKLAPQSQPFFTSDDITVWDKLIVNSCLRLGVKSLDTLLLHSPSDLLKPGCKYLQSWLLGLRDKGLVNRIGLSIYEASDLCGLPVSLFDVIQIPISLFDQRLLSDGTIYRLKDQGLSLHARSIYLQGLLLTTSDSWPDWIDSDIRLHQSKLENLSIAKDCRLIDLALGFIRELDVLDLAIVGICNAEQLKQLTLSWNSPSPWTANECNSWALTNTQLLDPRCWPR